jgi:hypothetical protein
MPAPDTNTLVCRITVLQLAWLMTLSLRHPRGSHTFHNAFRQTIVVFYLLSLFYVL